MPVIIGTAGHIDHGKTSLVKALTGEDTDRLKEEKERGISIDLGFAHLDLPDGTRAGVVDVPGHERFIRNMLAGAHGIDLVLFTVAADDGVMPQTEEHLDILHLLAVDRAIFVITKTDLATPARIREVEDEIRILTDGTSLQGSPILQFSFVTGAGLPELRSRIVEMLQGEQHRHSEGYFRLPVDRVFALQGHGLIVTGTALSGQIKVGDRVRCLPGDQLFRVRSLQVHDQPVDVATWGQRVALNLSGQDRQSLERGHVICHEKLTMTSGRFDAFVEVRPTADNGLKSHQRIRVHIGTAERLAKVIVLSDRDEIKPRASDYCQIALSEDVLALHGDRFVIRDETAQKTLGGGTVIHPWARKHKKSEAGLLETLRSFHKGDLATLVTAFIDASDDFAVSTTSLYQFLNVREDEAQERLKAIPAVHVLSFEGETLYTSKARWSQAGKQLVQSLTAFHAAHPLASGMDMEEARDKLPYQIQPRIFRAFVEQMALEKTIARESNLLRLPGHQIRLSDDERRAIERITALLRSNALSPPDAKQIETETGLGRAKVQEVLRLMERQQTVVRVAPDMYFLRDAVARMMSGLRDYLARSNELTPGTFRDLFGTSRKYTIPLLEYLDREGFTVRVGDVRKLKRGAGPTSSQ